MSIQIDGTSGISGVDGSATTPALQGTDTNTGLTFGTDTVNVVTGGTTRATVDSSGNVGIGTSSPQRELHVQGSTNGTIRLQAANTATSQLLFSDSDAEIRGRVGYFHTDDALDFYSAGNERMRIDSSGNVGIGTTSPSSQLELAGSAPVITLDATGNNQPTINLQQSGTTYARFRFDGSNVDIGNLYSGGSTIINAGNAERMRLLSNGHMGFGCTARLGQGGIFFRQDISNGAAEFTWNRADSALDSYIMLFHNNTNTVGSISHDNVSTAYNTSSDYRLKENIVDLDGAIDRVKQLLPRRFNFLVDPAKTVDGFIAHEAQTVVPEAVKGAHNEVEVWQEGEELPDGVSVGDNKLDEDGNTIPKYQGIDQSKLVPLLTAALQEAIGKIEALETRVVQLEGGAS